MSNILSSIFTTSFAASIIRIMVPILFAALAASVTEKAGVVNIGLEGTIPAPGRAAAPSWASWAPWCWACSSPS